MLEAVTDKIVVEEMRRVKSEGGIIIPEMVNEPQRYGKVVSIGPDVEGMKIGDVIVCHPREMQTVLLEKKIYGVVRHEGIYGKLDEESCKELVTMEISGVSEGEKLVKPVGGGQIVRP